MKKITALLLALFVCTVLFAQQDYNYPRPAIWQEDSITFVLHHLRTQSAIDDTIKDPTKFARDIAKKYIFVKEGILYALFPKGYQPYLVASMATNVRDDSSKTMIQIITRTKTGAEETRDIRTNALMRQQIVDLVPISKRSIIHLWL